MTSPQLLWINILNLNQIKKYLKLLIRLRITDTHLVQPMLELLVHVWELFLFCRFWNMLT